MTKSFRIKQISYIALFLAMLFLCVSQAKAAEITAIDFNGDVLGKIIPDGKVVSLDNQLIGNVTTDSFILDYNGNIIGGVIPQGIAIGNDNKLLGKVNNDGSVRLASGKVVGRVLPTGLVVDEGFSIIGSVLFPGLIYDNRGRVIGRLTGDGVYTNLNGEEIGFVSANGYAYRRIDRDASLEGRLISSKMVVSNAGEFMGSVVPGGKVTNFDSVIIGSIRANGLVYDTENNVIGGIVNTSYAFDNLGNYLGIVAYNGEVINKDQLMGRLASNGSIIDPDGNAIGYSLELSATATDLNGRYLGRLNPNGNVVRSREVIGRIGARGLVFDNNGKVLGKILSSGPVFDYAGTLKAQALKNGRVILPDGSPFGYIKGEIAYDNGSRVFGATQDKKLIYSNDNIFQGVTDIDSTLTFGDEKLTVSPFGFVFSGTGEVVGQSLKSKEIYNLAGANISTISLNGKMIGSVASLTGNITQSGFALDERNRILGKSICATYAVDDKGTDLGNLAYNNQILDSSQKVISKVLPDQSIVPIGNGVVMPRLGTAYSEGLVLGFDGSLLGAVDYFGITRDLSNNPLGRTTANSQVIDNTGSLIGGLVENKVFVDMECKTLGILSSRGDVRNARDIMQGRALLNNQVVTEGGDVIGYGIKDGLGAVIDDKGNTLGIISNNGQVVDYSGKALGCIDKRGFLKNKENAVLGGTIEYQPVINFKDKIIGRITLDGSVINEDGQGLGYVQPTGNINSKTGIPIGSIFKYQVAFDNDNKFLGRVLSDATVINSRNQIVGTVDFDGYVNANGKKIGFALYDMYIYDNDFNTIGYISKDGNVISLNGQNIGTMDRGFYLDRNFKVIGRGNRDFYIRDDSNLIIGELTLEGTLLSPTGQTLGTLQGDGGIINTDGTFVGEAKPLQYYNKTVNRLAVYDENGNIIGYQNPDGTVINDAGKIVGIVGSDNLVRDANGNIIGGLGLDWFEKAEPYIKGRDLPDVGYSSGQQQQQLQEQARRSLSIALTPDGEYLGEILSDGRVVDKNGKAVGRKMPDGLIIDDEGTLIGIEESKKPDSSEIFVPAGTFGPGNAYGTGAGPGSNLGPGGGFGPGERYDPARAAALAAAQNERRRNMGVGRISSNIRREAADMQQKDWDEQGIVKNISSWRVDMSEMILADKPIPAVIARSIDSNNPTPVTAFVERNIFAEEGRNIIIPAGSRLIGSLGSVNAAQEATSHSAKIEITWERLIRPDGVMFVFQGITGDAMGRGGALGYLDQQLFKKYSLPLMTTVLTSAASYLMAPSEDRETENETPRQEAASDARQNFLDQMNSVFEQILQDKADIRPLVYVPAGTRIIVYPDIDLWLRTSDRDQDASTNRISTREILIDDTREKREDRDSDYGRQSASGNVVYDSGTQSYQPVEKQHAPVLIDDAAEMRRDAASRTPPPPPASYSYTPPAQTTPTTTAPKPAASAPASNNSSNIPQLF